MQVINKHLSHEDDIDVGKDEQIVEIERKLSMRINVDKVKETDLGGERNEDGNEEWVDMELTQFDSLH